MSHWIDVGEDGRQFAYFRDATFSFGIFMDDFVQMDGHALPLHWHPAAEFQIVRRGRVRLRIRDEVMILSPGDCVFVNANTLHGAEQIGAADAMAAVLSFTPALFTKDVQSTVYRKYFAPYFGREVFGFRIDPSEEGGAEAIRLIGQLAELSDDGDGYELDAVGLMSALWKKTTRMIEARTPGSGESGDRAWRQNETAKTLLTFVERNYGEPVTVDSLAAAAHLSRRECFRYFRRYTGRTPVEYVNDVRLAQAAHLLSTTALSLSAVGLSCGFPTQSYFSRRFREKFGCTPSAYRIRRAETREESDFSQSV